MIYLLFFGLIAGQLFKLPINNFGGITVLDLSLMIFIFFSTTKYGLSLKKLPLWFKAGLVFAVISAVSLLLTPLTLDWNQKFISFSYLIRFLLFLTAGLLVYRNCFELKKNIFNLLLLSGLALAALGILQLVFLPNLLFLTAEGWDPHFYRTVSTFLDPNFAGAFFALTLIILYLAKFSRGGNLVIDLLSLKKYLLLFGLLFLALLTTFSRSSYLSFGVGFLLIAAVTKSIRTFILTVILAAVLFLGFNVYLQLIAAPQNIDRAGSAGQRFGSWQQGLIIWQKNPVLGTGFNSYRFALEQYGLADNQQIESHGGSTNDSSLLYVLATTGVVGLGAYLFFLYTILKTGWQNYRRKNIWGLALFSGLLGLTAQSFFANTLFFPPLLGWIIFSVAQLSDSNS